MTHDGQRDWPSRQIVARTSSSPKPPAPEPLRQSSLASSRGSRPAASAAPTRESRARLSVDSASFSVSSARMLPARPHLHAAAASLKYQSAPLIMYLFKTYSDIFLVY